MIIPSADVSERSLCFVRYTSVSSFLKQREMLQEIDAIQGGPLGLTSRLIDRYDIDCARYSGASVHLFDCLHASSFHLLQLRRNAAYRSSPISLEIFPPRRSWKGAIKTSKQGITLAEVSAREHNHNVEQR